MRYGDTGALVRQHLFVTQLGETTLLTPALQTADVSATASRSNAWLVEVASSQDSKDTSLGRES